MTDELAPEAPDAEESRRLKEAVASLGASMREDMERAKQNPVAGVPIMAEPRERTDPRVDALTQQLAALMELQEAGARQADALEAVQAAERERQAAAADRLARDLEAAKGQARTALIVAAVAVVVAIVAVLAALLT